MSDLQDFDLQGGGTPEGEEGSRPTPGRLRGPLLWVAIAAVALLFAGLTWTWLARRGAPEPEVEAGPIAAPARPVEPSDAGMVGESDEPLPALDASDALVRRLVSSLSARPEIVAWLASEDLIRRFAVAVVNVAEGESPRPHLGFLAPQGPFSAADSPSGPVISPAAYERYRVASEVFASLDTAGTVALFRRLAPLLDEAYRDLGYPGRTFESALVEALQAVVAVTPIDDPVDLVPGVESYRFADERLERLPPFEKQLLRLGPDNLRRVQGKARELLAALGSAAARG